MRTIKLTEDEVNTMFRLIYQTTSELDRRLAESRKERHYSVEKFIMDEMKVLDTIGKKMMHAHPPFDVNKNAEDVHDDSAY